LFGPRLRVCSSASSQCTFGRAGLGHEKKSMWMENVKYDLR
jgi:hypothetical protein